MELKTGDIILTRSFTRLSRLISFFSTEPGEKKAYWTHAAMVTRGGRINSPTCVAIESSAPRVHVQPVSQIIKGKSYLVLRRLGMDPRTAKEVSALVMQDLGRKYPIPKLALHFMDWLMEKITGKDWGFFSRLGKYGPRKECSVLVSYGFYQKFGELFGKKSPEEVKPGDIADYAYLNPVWVKVEESRIPES